MAFNNLVWRMLAKTPDGDYYEGVSSLFDREPPEMLRQSLNLEAGKVLAGVALHERLRWFTGDWLRYDVVGDALVVTDLRMGVPGNQFPLPDGPA
jgi:inner membrane protein